MTPNPQDSAVALDVERAAMRAALERILEEPKNNLSDGKALKAIVRIAKGALSHPATQADALQAECAGLTSSVSMLSALVDRHLTSLRRAASTMKALHETATPDEDTPDLDARIPAHAFRVFVDAHAELLQELALWNEPRPEILRRQRP